MKNKDDYAIVAGRSVTTNGEVPERSNGAPC